MKRGAALDLALSNLLFSSTGSDGIFLESPPCEGGEVLAQVGQSLEQAGIVEGP